MKGRKSHGIVEQALTAVCCLNHRGAAGAEADTGDAAGILIQTPDAFFRAIVPFDLPPEGPFAPAPAAFRRPLGRVRPPRAAASAPFSPSLPADDLDGAVRAVEKVMLEE